MFAYCNNNPIVFSDSSGNRPYSELERHGGESLSVPPRKTYQKKVEYDVPLYDQGETNLCWLYSTLMIESYKYNLEFTQTEITQLAEFLAKNIKGERNWNTAFFPPNAGSCCFIDSIDDLYALLRKSGPVYAYYKGSTPTGEKRGHVVVVTGVNVSTNTVYTNNSWYYRGEQTFEEFISGIAWDKPTLTNYKLKGIYPTSN